MKKVKATITFSCIQRAENLCSGHLLGMGDGSDQTLKKMFYRKLQILKVYYLGKFSREWA